EVYGDPPNVAARRRRWRSPTRCWSPRRRTGSSRATSSRRRRCSRSWLSPQLEHPQGEQDVDANRLKGRDGREQDGAPVTRGGYQEAALLEPRKADALMLAGDAPQEPFSPARTAAATSDRHDHPRTTGGVRSAGG